MSKYIFPVILIVLDIGAGIAYGINGDIKKLIYWFAASDIRLKSIACGKYEEGVF